jgi:ribosomal protein L18E
LKIKILGNGDLSRKIKIHAHSFSKTALDKIKKSGSEAIVIGGEAK